MNSFEDDAFEYDEDDVTQLANDAHWFKYIAEVINEDFNRQLHVDRSQQLLVDNALKRIISVIKRIK
jgi:hypothetical protein